MKIGVSLMREIERDAKELGRVTGEEYWKVAVEEGRVQERGGWGGKGYRKGVVERKDVKLGGCLLLYPRTLNF